MKYKERVLECTTVIQEKTSELARYLAGGTTRTGALLETREVGQTAVELIAHVAAGDDSEAGGDVAPTAHAAESLLLQRPALDDVGDDVGIAQGHAPDADDVGPAHAHYGLGDVGQPALQVRVTAADVHELGARPLEVGRDLDEPHHADERVLGRMVRRHRLRDVWLHHVRVVLGAA